MTLRLKHQQSVVFCGNTGQLCGSSQIWWSKPGPNNKLRSWKAIILEEPGGRHAVQAGSIAGLSQYDNMTVVILDGFPGPGRQSFSVSSCPAHALLLYTSHSDLHSLKTGGFGNIPFLLSTKLSSSSILSSFIPLGWVDAMGLKDFRVFGLTPLPECL